MLFRALPAPLQTDPHPLSGSADQEGKGSGCQASFLHLLQVCCQGLGAFHLQDCFPVSRLGLVGVGGPVPVRNVFGTLGESSRKTEGVLDGL